MSSNSMVKMLLLVLVIFMFLQQMLAYETVEKSSDLINKTTLFSYICDDEKLQNIEDKLNRIVSENENLRLKIDTLNIIMNHQFAELKTMIITTSIKSTTQTETKDINCTYSYDHLIDIRGDFNEEKSCQKSTLESKLSLPANCAEALHESAGQSGAHLIHLSNSTLEPFVVYCLADPEQPEAPWTIIQRRQDGTTNFSRKWNDYQQGFGNLEGEFFIGLDRLHALTHSSVHELWIQMEDFEQARRSANYSSFAIGSSTEAYALKVLGSFKGDAGDSLRTHAGHKFSTIDVDNDVHDTGHCAMTYKAGWWFDKCYMSNLNGHYFKRNTTEYAKGIVWKTWHGYNYSLKYVHMAIRSVRKSKIY